MSTLNTRPTFARRESDHPQIEMARIPSRPGTPLHRSVSNLLPADVYDAPSPPLPDSDRPPFFSGLANRLPIPTIQLPEPVRAITTATGSTLRERWRELAVGGVLTALTSWAIWATVKIARLDSIPFCVVDDNQGL